MSYLLFNLLAFNSSLSGISIVLLEGSGTAGKRLGTENVV